MTKFIMGVHTFTRPRLMELLRFEGADLFDSPSETIAPHADPVTALGSALDHNLGHCSDVSSYLDTDLALVIEIGAYRRMPIDSHDREAWSENLANKLREDFSEEHGDEEGDDRLSDADSRELVTKMRETVEWYLSRVKVYPCEVIQTWSFDTDDIRELVQQLRPEWLQR